MPTVSVLINNYNYGQFVSEAIDSVLQQTFQDFEIIIVDDGSTDNSLEIINPYTRIDKRVKLISKINGGQLSCFNTGFAACTGMYIYFLDSDDSYKPTYLEETINFYDTHHGHDFLFVNKEFFGQRDGIGDSYSTDVDFGSTALVTLHSKAWIGESTSCLSVKRNVLEKLLPLPYEADWVTRADDCIIWGTAIVGAKKYYMHRTLINYRAHDDNAFFGKSFSKSERNLRRLNVIKLFEYFKSNLYYPEGEQGAALLYEFDDKGFINRSLYRKYRRSVKRVASSLIQYIVLRYKLWRLYSKPK